MRRRMERGEPASALPGGVSSVELDTRRRLPQGRVPLGRMSLRPACERARQASSTLDARCDGSCPSLRLRFSSPADRGDPPGESAHVAFCARVPPQRDRSALLGRRALPAATEPVLRGRAPASTAGSSKRPVPASALPSASAPCTPSRPHPARDARSRADTVSARRPVARRPRGRVRRGRDQPRSSRRSARHRHLPHAPARVRRPALRCRRRRLAAAGPLRRSRGRLVHGCPTGAA